MPSATILSQDLYMAYVTILSYRVGVQDLRSNQSLSLEASFRTLLALDFTWVEEILLQKYSMQRRRPPHPPLAMFKALIYQHLKQIPSWRKLALTIKSDRRLAETLGFQRSPCHDSFSEFTRRIGDNALNQIFLGLVERVRQLMPDLGKVVAIDSTLVDAYSKPRKKGSRKTDPDVAWGVSGEYLGKPIYTYGYKLQVTCDAKHDIPLSFMVSSANRNDTRIFPDHLRSLLAQGSKPDVLTADAGYDSKRNNILCLKNGIVPIIALNPRRSRNKHRRRADYLLPITRRSPAWDYYYSMRSSIERVFSRLKEELGLKHLKLRRIPRATVHFVLCLITMLTIALASFSIGRPELYLSAESWRY